MNIKKADRKVFMYYIRDFIGAVFKLHIPNAKDKEIALVGLLFRPLIIKFITKLV